MGLVSRCSWSASKVALAPRPAAMWRWAASGVSRPDQVVAELGGEGVVGAVAEAAAAAVEGGLGGGWQAGVVLLFGGVDRDHADRLVDDRGVAVGGAGKLPRLGRPGRAWEVEGDHC